MARSNLRIAVLSLTRDRLAYTKHCFARLHELGGAAFDHYVLDQGSQDGTQEWLRNDYAPHWLELLPENVGVSIGINRLLDETRRHGVYDVIVKFDNDCEIVTPDSLAVAVEVAAKGPGWIISPHIQGLLAPPPVVREDHALGYRIGVPAGNIGGIFLAAPADLYEGYRHDETNPIWGMDDVNICAHWRQTGGEIGYLLDYLANHYETTKGQRERYPDYWARKEAEFRG